MPIKSPHFRPKNRLSTWAQNRVYSASAGDYVGTSNKLDALTNAQCADGAIPGPFSAQKFNEAIAPGSRAAQWCAEIPLMAFRELSAYPIVTACDLSTGGSVYVHSGGSTGNDQIHTTGDLRGDSFDRDRVTSLTASTFACHVGANDYNWFAVIQKSGGGSVQIYSTDCVNAAVAHNVLPGADDGQITLASQGVQVHSIVTSGQRVLLAQNKDVATSNFYYSTSTSLRSWSSAWAPPTPVTDILSSAGDYSCFNEKDGTILLIQKATYTTGGSGNGVRVWAATSLGGAWTELAPIPNTVASIQPIMLRWHDYLNCWCVLMQDGRVWLGNEGALLPTSWTVYGTSQSGARLIRGCNGGVILGETIVSLGEESGPVRAGLALVWTDDLGVTWSAARIAEAGTDYVNVGFIWGGRRIYLKGTNLRSWALAPASSWGTFGFETT